MLVWGEADSETSSNQGVLLTYPYEEVGPLNPPSPTSESEPDDEIEVEYAVESEDETVPASVHEVDESSTASFLREDSDGLLPGLMRRDINSLFGKAINKVLLAFNFALLCAFSSSTLERITVCLPSTVFVTIGFGSMRKFDGLSRLSIPLLLEKSRSCCIKGLQLIQKLLTSSYNTCWIPIE
ncbi:hypothetical protein Tco_0647432 [Tanacetum coccineum]